MNGTRLEAFEKMLAAVQAEYADIVSKMEKLKGEGKVKTVTYKQLMARRLTYQNMLSLYQIYGLTADGEETRKRQTGGRDCNPEKWEEFL